MKKIERDVHGVVVRYCVELNIVMTTHVLFLAVP